jgi:hypothetical protein
MRPRERMRPVVKRLMAVVAILAGLSASAQRSLAASDSRALPTVVVRGVLVDSTGSPLKGTILHAASLDADGRAFIEVREDAILNPTGTTDENGRFAITVPLAFFATGNAFTVGAGRLEAGIPPGTTQVPVVPLQRNGMPATFAYRGKQEALDLGEVTLP